MLGIDVSSAQPRDLASIISQYRPQVVVCKLYLPWESIPQDYSRAQIASAIQNGADVMGYVWAYADSDPIATVDESLALAKSCGLQPKVIWLDAETYSYYDQGPDSKWLYAAFDRQRSLGLHPGLYSGNWWLKEYLQDLSVLDGIWLWLAEYNRTADLDSVTLLPGLRREMLVGHQYSSDSIDQNVFDSRVV